jgi:hypothetical protein
MPEPDTLPRRTLQQNISPAGGVGRSINAMLVDQELAGDECTSRRRHLQRNLRRWPRGAILQPSTLTMKLNPNHITS